MKKEEILERLVEINMEIKSPPNGNPANHIAPDGGSSDRIELTILYLSLEERKELVCVIGEWNAARQISKRKKLGIEKENLEKKLKLLL